MSKKSKKGAATKKKTGKRGPKKKKQKTLYDTTRNVGLQKRHFSKIKQEYHDIDYIDKLSPKEKEWLSSFMQEDLGANFAHKDKKIYRKKKDKKESFHRNNARNRDIYSNIKASGRTVDIKPETALGQWQDDYSDFNYEDRLIEQIENKDQEE